MHSDETLRILVVDDEPNVRRLLTRWCTSAGYECRDAADVDEAWGLLNDERYALLVSDINMPGKSGLELLAMTVEHFPNTAVVMVTALDDRDVAIGALQMGAYGYVIKPFEKNEILINVANALERRRLTLETRAYAQRLEHQVQERTADIRQREEEIVLRLATAAEFRDDETGAHNRRTGLFASAFAEALGWAPRLADDLRIAAPMHDVGKIGVPDSILLKPDKLTPEEFETIKTHTTIGAQILSGPQIPLLLLAKEIAWAHHEKWDGWGYPRGLAGEAIPTSARIAAICDVYDALMTNRVYRPALPEDQALPIMMEQRGRQFDPDLFDCFLALLPRFRAIREECKETRNRDDSRAYKEHLGGVSSWKEQS